MPVEQGIATQIKRVKQTGLGVPGSVGSKLIRRVSLTLNKQAETYSSNEIASHQQSTGATEGPYQVAGALNGELSAGTYDLEFAALLRKNFAATAAITALTVTIAGAGPTYTISRASGWLVDGVKLFDVIRLSVGALNAANSAKNLMIVGLTATVATVIPLNGVALAAEGPITGCTVTVIGKKSWAPTTGHTNDYFSWEKLFTTLTRSELFTDVKPASADITVPATGIPSVNFAMAGLARSSTASEVLTAPTAETTSQVLGAVQGRIVINGVITAVTGFQLKLDGATSTGEAEVGAATLSDLQRGRISVSGSFSAKFSDVALQVIRDNQSVVALCVALADSGLAAAEFLTFAMPAIKIFTDDADDGEKQIVRSYNFTAQWFGAGGAALASHATTLSIQDSLA